jgi:hypothetical protein
VFSPKCSYIPTVQTALLLRTTVSTSSSPGGHQMSTFSVLTDNSHILSAYHAGGTDSYSSERKRPKCEADISLGVA